MARKSSAPTVSFFAFQDIITSVVGIFVLIALIMMLQVTQTLKVGKSKGELVADTQASVVTQMQSEVTELKQRLEELRKMQASLGSSQTLSDQQKREEIERQMQEIEARLKQFEQLSQQTSEAIVQAELQLTEMRRKAIEAEQKNTELKKMLGKLEFLQAQFEMLNQDKTLIYREQSLEGKSLVVISLEPQKIELMELADNRKTAFSASDGAQALLSHIAGHKPESYHFLVLVRPNCDRSFAALKGYFMTKGLSYGVEIVGKDQSAMMQSEMRGTNGV